MKRQVEPRERLLAKIRDAGGQCALAKRLGVTQPYISALLHGRRDFNERICEKLGIERQIIYLDI